MKVTAVALILVISALIYLQADATRSLLTEMKKEKARDQPSQAVQAGQKLEVLKSGTNDNEPKDNQESSMPTADANGQTYKNSAAQQNNKDEYENNDNYGAYGNPSDSSTESHHCFTGENRPHKPLP